MSPIQAVTIGVVDDHTAIGLGVLAGLAPFLPLTAQCAEAATVAELLDTSVSFDLVILDVRLADGSDVVENVTWLVDLGIPVVLYTTEPQSLSAGRGLLAQQRLPSVRATRSVPSPKRCKPYWPAKST